MSGTGDEPNEGYSREDIERFMKVAKDLGFEGDWIDNKEEALAFMNRLGVLFAKVNTESLFNAIQQYLLDEKRTDKP